VDGRHLRSDATRFFVSVQHNVAGFGVVLEVTDWM
jgi:hypothetical protein